jgi:hypothetical protein
MKQTIRMLIHDAKVFNQLRRDYRQAKKNRSTRSNSEWLFRFLTGGRGRNYP